MAIAVLKKRAFDKAQESLVQLSAWTHKALISEADRRAIDTFLAQSLDADLDEGPSAPEANAYGFQSHGIIEMLEKLLDKFSDERTVLEKEEMMAKHAFGLLVDDLKAQIGNAEQDISDKSDTKAKKLEAKAAAEADV